MSWDDEDADDWQNAATDQVAGGSNVDLWAGEDEEDEALADGWDEEDKPKTAATVVPGTKKLTKRQIAKKKEEAERERARARQVADNMSEEEYAKIKEEERKRIEKEDLMQCSDLFGDMGDLSIDIDAEANRAQGDANEDNADMTATLSTEARAELKAAEKIPAGVKDYELKTTTQFKAFGEEVGAKVASSVNPRARGEGQKLVDFLKIVISQAVAPMSLDEANDVKKHFNSIYNLKAKDPTKKKKAGKKKNAVKMSSSAGNEAYGGGYHDDYDDFGF